LALPAFGYYGETATTGAEGAVTATFEVAVYCTLEELYETSEEEALVGSYASITVPYKTGCGIGSLFTTGYGTGGEVYSGAA
jgi:hypothetical protein